MALPMVLWTIALLAAVTLLLAGIIEGWISEETREGKQFRARQQALSGLAVAMNPSVTQGDPLLSHQEGDEGYKVVIKDESGLINPNFLLGATPDRRDLLGKLFTAWGIDTISSETAADGLYDWQSSSPFRSLHGAKKSEYNAAGRAGFPPGAPFTSPEEMALVLGFDPVMQAKPDWRSYFTTYYNGKINILHAPKTILTDLLGLSEDQASQWISLRNGKDGLEGTSDDLTVDTIDHAADLIGCNAVQRTVILAACDVTGSVRRIESTGTCNDVKRTISVILSGSPTDNAQPHPNLLGWSEQ
jgi:hypothetical protein